MREQIASVHYENEEPVEVVLLTVDYHREGERWLAECVELGTAAYASTLEESRKEAVDAVLLQLNEVERLGFIEGFLQEHRVVRIPLTRSTRSGAPKQAWEVALSAGA